jgi:hypothetical protein
MRAVAALLIALLSLSAHAEVVFHDLPHGAGVSPEQRRSIAALVRAHLKTAGHKLGKKKRKAQIFLTTLVSRYRARYAVRVGFRLKSEKTPAQIFGVADGDTMLATLRDLLEQVMPTKPLSSPAPAAAAPVVAAEPVAEAPPPAFWPDLHHPPAALVRFPEPVDPPPLIGEMRPPTRQ